MAFDDRVTYTGQDVVTAAKERIAELFATCDHVICSFSGGKDSLAVLHLTREVMDELGLEAEPTKAIFRDEELIQDDVIDLVTRYVHDPRFDIKYIAVPMKSSRLVLGEITPYIQWDESRTWIRDKPEFAITQLHPENKPIDKLKIPLFEFPGWRGKIGYTNGIRANESLARIQSTFQNRGRRCWVTNGVHPSSVFCRVIYDWTEKDVFRFFYDRGIEYADIYNKEMWCGAELRVSPALGSSSFDQLRRMAEMYPVFYAQICDIFPDTDAQVRYWDSIDQYQVMRAYPKGFDGIRQYIDDHIKNPQMYKRAISELRHIVKQKNFNRVNGRFVDPGECYGYPLLYIWRAYIKGSYSKRIVPCVKPTRYEVAFEREVEQDLLRNGTGY